MNKKNKSNKSSVFALRLGVLDREALDYLAKYERRSRGDVIKQLIHKAASEAEEETGVLVGEKK